MGNLFCLMGKSSSGKDTVYKQLLNEEALSLQRIIPYTTRPVRFGETDGIQYNFVDERRLAELEEAGKVIELRAYHTMQGVWKYFTVDDGQINLEKHNYLTITTLEAYLEIRRYFGKSAVVPIYIEVEDGERLQRALNQERLQKTPGYAELCRRFLADTEDFSEEKLEEAEIKVRFVNENIVKTRDEIIVYIQTFL